MTHLKIFVFVLIALFFVRTTANEAQSPTHSNVEKLKLKWAFGIPGATEGSTQPTVSGGHVFIGTQDGTVYSLDAQSGGMDWAYKAAVSVRAPVVVDPNKATAFFGDMQSNIYAVDANTGKLKWKNRVGDHPYASIAGAPKLEGDRLYVPISGGNEEVAAAFPDYECCTLRGSVIALDAESGRRIWRTYTIADPPKVIGRNIGGTEQWGPSGASVWSSPALDSGNRILYVATGVNYSNPATSTSDAVIALDMDSGRILWTTQFTANDRFNFACVSLQETDTNCPSPAGRNFDLGSAPILASSQNGRFLIAADKSGIVHALDPNNGRIRWEARVANGGMMGGILWGGATDDRGLVYFPISDWDVAKPESGGGVVALRIDSGEKVWSRPAPKPTCLGVPGCSAAQPGPAVAGPGVVFAGSLDGHLRAYDSADGRIIWDFDTLTDFQTVNGVKARGGSINRSGPAVAGSFVYVSSGYSRMPAIPGNVVLAFSPQP
jgi:polyvinyl alcohol dehydrogenase (cytochrome)